MRASWSLDELASHIVNHYRYRDKTALFKSLIRGTALIGKESDHSMLVRLSHEPPAVQDKLDAELLRRWHAGETIGLGPLTRLVREVAKRTGHGPAVVMAAAADELIATARVSARANGSNGFAEMETGNGL